MRTRMHQLTLLSLFVLALGLWTVVGTGGVYKILIALPTFYFMFIYFKEEKRAVPYAALFLFLLGCLSYVSNFLNLDQLGHFGMSFRKPTNLLAGALPVFAYFYFFKEHYKPRHGRHLMLTLMATIVLASLVGYLNMKYDFHFEKGRVGKFQDRLPGLTGVIPYSYAIGHITCVFLFLSLAHNKIKNLIPISRNYYVFMTVFCAAFTVRADARGAILTMLLCLILILFFYSKKAALIFSSALVVLSLGLYSYVQINPDFRKSSRLLKKEDLSKTSRAKLFEFALSRIPDKPLLGHGVHSYKFDILRHNAQFTDKALQLEKAANPHNIILGMLYEQGLIGFLLFVGWIAAWLYSAKVNLYLFQFVSVFNLYWLTASQANLMYYWDVQNTFTINIVFGITLAMAFVEKQKQLKNEIRTC